VSGRIIHQQELTPTALQSAGSMLGRMHRLSLTQPIPANPRRGIKPWDSAASLALANQLISIIKAIPQPTGFDRMALETLQLKCQLIATVDTQYDDYGLKPDHLIHGDYHELNLFFDKHDQVTHTFDLEKTGIAPRLLEVIRSVHIMCLNPGFGPAEVTQARHFLSGYHAAYPIVAGEFRRALQVYHIRLMHSMWVEEFHYLEHNHRTDVFLAKEHGVLTYLSEHFEELQTGLLAPVTMASPDASGATSPR
jgi:homoserine kinase type II